MYPAGVLSVLVTATTGQANASLRKTQTMFRATAAVSESSAARTAASWKKAGFVAAAGMAFAGAASAKLAIDFEKGMRNVNSIAQLPEPAFRQLEKSVLSLAGPTAQAPQTLAEGMYFLVSSGFSAKESLNVVEQSAYAATAGLTDAATSTKAVSAVLNAYRMPASKAKDVSDILFRTVDRGVLTFEELAEHIGDTLPFASQIGVNLKELGAATATMTKQGLKAPETMTRIRNVLQTLIKPGEDLQAVFKAVGMSGEEMIAKFGFQGTLDRLLATLDLSKDALKDLPSDNLEKLKASSSAAKDEVAKLFPNIRALGGVLALTGGNTAEAHKNLDLLAKSSGATARALSEQSKSTAYQWQKAVAEMKVMAIELGNALLPVFTALILVLKDVVGALADFVKWIGSLPTPLLAAVGAMIATYAALKVLSMVFTAFTAASAIKTISAFISILSAAVVEMGLFRGAWFAVTLAFATNPIGAAAVSVGLLAGAFLGLKSILGGDSMSKIQERVAEASERSAKAFDAQTNSIKELSGATRRIKNLKDKEADVSGKVKDAEENLARVRENSGKSSRPAIRAEARLVRLKSRHEDINKRLAEAERLHGEAKKAAKLTTKDAVREASNEIVVLKEQRDQLNKTLRAEVRKSKRQGHATDELKETQDSLRENSKNLQEAQEGLTKTLGRAQQAISGKFSKSMRDASRQVIKAGQSSKTVARLLEDPFGEAIEENIEQFQDSRQQAKMLGVDVPKAYRKAQLGADVAIGKLGNATQNALQQLGVDKKITFGSKTVKRKSGGAFEVGGHGSGDRVPVNLMLEPGETGFILNKHASKAIANLKEANKRWPRSRMQRGGMVDPAGPGTGIVNPAIAGVVGKWSQRYNAAINYGYDPGGGHVSPGHNVTGTATDTSPAAGWAGASLRLFEQGLRAIEGSVDQILYGTAGIGTSYPNHGRGNHAHIEWGFHPGGISGAGIKIPRVVMTGPPGALRNMGQGALDEIRKAAQKYVNKQMAKFGETGEAGLMTAGGAYNKTELAKLWTRANGGLGNPNLMAAIALAESGGNPNARNPSGASGLWQILGRPPGIGGNIFDPLVNAKMAGWKFKTQGLGAWVAYTSGAYRQYMNKGGLIKSERLMKKLKRSLGKIEKQDEYIDIAERTAALLRSPAGSDLSAGEVSEQLELQEKLLGHLRKAARISKTGQRTSSNALDRYRKGDDRRTKSLEHDLDQLRNRREAILDRERKKKPGQRSSNATGSIDRLIDKKHTAIEKRKEEVSKQMDKLRELRRSFADSRKEMVGATGKGGRIFDTLLSIKELEDTTTGIFGGGLSIDQLMSFAAAVRYGAFNSQLPEFHAGGIVRPPRAGQQEMAALLQKDEGIVPREIMRSNARNNGNGNGQPIVEIEFADGMGWLRQFMDVRIKQNDKKKRGAYLAA